MAEKAALTLEAMTTTSDTDFMLDRKHERKTKPENKSNAAVVNFKENTVIDEKAQHSTKIADSILQMYQKLFPFYSAHVSIKNSYGSEKKNSNVK